MRRRHVFVYDEIQVAVARLSVAPKEIDSGFNERGLLIRNVASV